MTRRTDLLNDLMQRGTMIQKENSKISSDEALHPYFKTPQYLMAVGMLKVFYLKGTYGDHKIANGLN